MMPEIEKPIVKFRNVGKEYDKGTQVIRDLDLDIAEGEFLTLLGPSGSGKTTCLMLLAGFETPTSGEIWLRDTLINLVQPHRRDIGMVFQDYALFPHMTVAQNVAYALTVRRTPSREKKARVKRALEAVQMEDFIHRRPSQLSGGQQQRVAVARALVFNPHLVLMDEPLSALDKQLREQMQLELKELHRELGITFLYVTHDQAEALTMSDRIAVFDAGRIQQIGTVNKIYEEPENAIVAKFIGKNNEFIGKLIDIDGIYCKVKLPCGEIIKGVKSDTFDIGEEVLGCIRPERISVSREYEIDARESHSIDNTINVKTQSIIYYGDTFCIRCIFREQIITVTVPPDHPAVNQFSPERDMQLNFSSDYFRVFRQASNQGS